MNCNKKVFLVENFSSNVYWIKSEKSFVNCPHFEEIIYI